MILAEIMTLEAALLAGIGALTASVTVLFGRMNRQGERIEKQLDLCRSDLAICQDDRRQLSERILKLEQCQPPPHQRKR